MNAFQKGAISKCNEDIGVLLPFNEFYATIEEFMDFDVKNVFEKAKKKLKNDFDIEVLKVLTLVNSYQHGYPYQQFTNIEVGNMPD